ncbi:hypothetical protein GGR53DRAFT_31566 [Hypoxylon sp. FL1150]|nr:hypothetical protein GGR53DRAFT_31566 [Hypoxylon sp. FL1150]
MNALSFDIWSTIVTQTLRHDQVHKDRMERLHLSVADRVHRQQRQEEFRINPPSQYQVRSNIQTEPSHGTWRTVNASRVPEPPTSTTTTTVTTSSPSSSSFRTTATNNPDHSNETTAHQAQAKTTAKTTVPTANPQSHHRSRVLRDIMRAYHERRGRRATDTPAVRELVTWRTASEALQEHVMRQVEEERRWMESEERREQRRC